MTPKVIRASMMTEKAIYLEFGLVLAFASFAGANALGDL